MKRWTVCWATLVLEEVLMKILELLICWTASWSTTLVLRNYCCISKRHGLRKLGLLRKSMIYHAICLFQFILWQFCPTKWFYRTKWRGVLSGSFLAQKGFFLIINTSPHHLSGWFVFFRILLLQIQAPNQTSAIMWLSSITNAMAFLSLPSLEKQQMTPKALTQVWTQMMKVQPPVTQTPFQLYYTGDHGDSYRWWVSPWWGRWQHNVSIYQMVSRPR